MANASLQNFLAYLFALSSEQRGKAFELYCKWYLENEPAYRHLFKRVDLWDNSPHKWGRDKGIDLIAETHDGKLWAIQAKAYDSKHYISKADIDSFLSESNRSQISYRLLIATTDGLGANAREVLQGQEKNVGLLLLNALEQSALEWPASVNELYPIKKNPIKSPRPHQEAALNDILAGFKQSSLGQVHMACGTGKTLIGLWLAQRLACKNVLVLVPSISLVSQHYHRWVENAGDFLFDPLFVCSDQSLSKRGDDENIMQVADLALPVTTDSKELQEILQQSSRPKIIFSTYQSSQVIADLCALDPELSFDVVIADEAHRCAGKDKSEFALIVNQMAIRAQRKLFMTATPKIFSEHVKQKTGEMEYAIASMDDETKFGPIFHRLSFSSAIKQDLLTDYQVVISIMDHEQYREYAEKGRFIEFNNHETDARTLASQILIAKVIMHYDLNRLITFHSKKSKAKEFIESFNEAIACLEAGKSIGYAATIFGDMPQSERKKILKNFEANANTGANIIANVKCLSEGVDVPSLDGIAFIDPKSSEIDIVQAVGRVIRKDAGKNIGTIIIPIFIDKEMGEDQALDDSCFKVIAKVIRALRAHDDILAEELDTIRLELGKRTYKKPPKLNKIHIDVPVKISQEFVDKLSIRVIKTASFVPIVQSHPELAKEWHPTKNGDLRAEDVSSGSNQKVWWLCSVADDHEWDATCWDRAHKKYGCPYCSNRRVSKTNNLGFLYPEIAKEWHPTKNAPLFPHQVIAGGHGKYYWLCEKGSDHEWPATTISRINGNGCPFCAQKRTPLSKTLGFLYPELAKYFHPTKNGNLNPFQIGVNYRELIIWICSKDSLHEWVSSVDVRVKNWKKSLHDCEICNSLLILYPEIASQWHPTKNYPKIPDRASIGSNELIWWKCDKGSDHEWPQSIKSRIMAIKKSKRGQSICQVCLFQFPVSSNCLATTHPEIAKEWDYEKNAELKVDPYTVTHVSRTMANWMCIKSHKWPAVIRDRTSKSTKCPYCSGRKVCIENSLLTTHPEIATQWHPTKNGTLTSDQVSKGSEIKIIWLCEKGHEWPAYVYSRTAGKGCLRCKKK